MEKNDFLVINDLIYEIYSWRSTDDIRENFFQRLKIIVPFSYASILLKKNSDPENIELCNPICYPEAFTEAEEAYIASESDSDYMLWNLYARESKLLRASDVLDEEKRLNSPLYTTCYKKFDVFDDMQFTIVNEGRLFGILTLYRTRADGVFTTEDMFFVRALGMHLNRAMHRLLAEAPAGGYYMPDAQKLTDLKERCCLTERESEILTHLCRLENNTEIADALGIRESTLQKHLQNLFRKLDVTSKWEVLRMQAE